MLLWGVRVAQAVDIECYSLLNDWCIIFEPIEDGEPINIKFSSPRVIQSQVTGFTIGGKSGATEIPSLFFEIFPATVSAHIRSGKVSVLRKKNFKFAKNLSNLELKGNRLRSISREVFTEAKKLNRVDLESNHITEIEDYAFSGASALTFVILKNNLLTRIKKSTFAGAPLLNNIWLANNQIETIEDGAFDLPKLKIIYLGNNKLKSLPATIFAKSPLMEAIDVASNQLDRVGNIFYPLKQLTLLRLENNQVPDLDLMKFENSKLNLLYLSNTSVQLPIAPPEAGNKFAALQYLIMDNNRLSNPNIFEYLRMFKDLKWLDISNNEFTHINNLEAIYHDFPHFERLRVHGNHFSCKWTEKEADFDRRIFWLEGVDDYRNAIENLPCE